MALTYVFWRNCPCRKRLYLVISVCFLVPDVARRTSDVGPIFNMARMPEPVKPVISIFTGIDSLFGKVEEALSERLGKPDYISQLISFHQTAYYEKEMGSGLVRRVYSFPRLMDQSELQSLKRFTIGIEDRWRVEERRQVNIDPGYVSLAKLVLATTKDNVHRVYIGDGIFAEVALYFQKGRFHPWPWTYPDYASDVYRAVFEDIRSIYRRQLRTLKEKEV